MQTPAPSAQAGNKKAPRKAAAKHPVFPVNFGKAYQLVCIALFNDAALSRTTALKERLWNAKSFKADGNWLAIHNAADAMFERTTASFRAARDAGELLFCWHGSKTIVIKTNAVAVAP